MSDADQTHADLRGVGRLAVDAVTGVVGIVESVHRSVSGLAPVVGSPLAGRPRGVAGLIYRGIRGVTWGTGWGLDAVLGRLAPVMGRLGDSPRREASLAALNGVVGDHLAATSNPLAIAMCFRVEGRPVDLDRESLARRFPEPRRRVAIMVHGLCRNDLQWTCAVHDDASHDDAGHDDASHDDAGHDDAGHDDDGHDHGDSIRGAGYSVLYLHYNTGLPIATNGRELARLLERLDRHWPVPIDELVLVGHSMGGLVARSACHAVDEATDEHGGHAWRRALAAMVFLGTPHLGAPLERAGRWVDRILDLSPYSAPFSRLGKIRSAGIQDLRYGTLVDAVHGPEDREAGAEDVDGEPAGRRAAAGSRTPRHVPLPEGVRCFAIAATGAKAPGRDGGWLPGDGLVPVASALGEHASPDRSLSIPASRRFVLYGANHFALLGSLRVRDRIVGWLAEGRGG